MGRTAEPTALKLVKGARKDRINADEPVPSTGEIVAPTLSDRAQAIWDRQAPDLIAKKVLTPWDTDAFGVFCEAAAANLEAAGILAKEGVVVDRGNGPAKNPYFQIWRDTADVMARYGAKFGLTPSDRAGLKVGDGSKANSKEDFLT